MYSKRKLYIGFDLGKASVGACCTDENYDVIKFTLFSNYY